jgi:hypothetical protein
MTKIPIEKVCEHTEKEESQMWEEKLKLNLILNNDGQWISWELFRDLYIKDEHGYTGDILNGEVVYTSKYVEYFYRQMFSQAKHQEGVRILGRTNYISTFMCNAEGDEYEEKSVFLSDLTNIINNHE